ncbi:MAG: hypothetical protein H6R37_1365, partial [Deltaproteobacteria bacterium]|nr:hypothetical protein [Deltaproteobacteria bacterium]
MTVSMPGKPGHLREPWELGKYLKFQEATGGAIYGIRTRKAITVTRRSRFFGAYDQRQGRFSFSLGPSTRATAYGCGHLLGMGVEQARFSRDRAERSVAKSKGDEVGAPRGGAHFLT